jgi:hypothetical protein
MQLNITAGATIVQGDALARDNVADCIAGALPLMRGFNALQNNHFINSRITLAALSATLWLFVITRPGSIHTV